MLNMSASVLEKIILRCCGVMSTGRHDGVQESKMGIMFREDGHEGSLPHRVWNSSGVVWLGFTDMGGSKARGGQI
jgi:hypothetical protein